MSGPRLVTNAPAQLTIDTRNDGDSVTVVLSGEIDIASAPALERALEDIERSSPRRIVLDLSALDFLDSTAIHLLLNAQMRARAGRRQLVLTHVPGHVQRVFQLTGLTAQLDIQ